MMASSSFYVTPLSPVISYDDNISISPRSTILPSEWGNSTAPGNDFLRSIWNKINTPDEPKIPAIPLPANECDYERDPTVLYKMIEAKKWKDVKEFLETSSRKIVTYQANTWVARKEASGKLRWRMLPLHAAIIFKGPLYVIEALLLVAPHTVQCKDDQGKLPLHLAFRNDASDEVIEELLTVHPLGMEMRDRKGRVPLQCAAFSRKENNPRKLMETYLSLAIASERNKIINAANEEHEKIVREMREEYEKELSKVETSALEASSELRKSRVSCNAMMTRVANVTDLESEFREQIHAITSAKEKQIEAITEEKKKVEKCLDEVKLSMLDKDKTVAEKLESLKANEECMSGLENSLALLKEKLLSKEAEIDAALKDKFSSENEIKNLRVELDEVKVMVKVKDDQINILRPKFTDLQKRHDELSRKAEKFEYSFDRNKDKCEGYEGAIKVLSIMKNELESEMDTMRAKNQAQETAIKRLAEVAKEQHTALRDAWAERERVAQSVVQSEDAFVKMMGKNESSLKDVIAEEEKKLERFAAAKELSSSSGRAGGRTSRHSSSSRDGNSTLAEMPSLADCDMSVDSYN